MEVLLDGVEGDVHDGALLGRHVGDVALRVVLRHVLQRKGCMYHTSVVDRMESI